VAASGLGARPGMACGGSELIPAVESVDTCVNISG
jgi:hypothetical protein